MNVTEAILERRSVRAFTRRPVSPEVLEKLCDVARFYASGGNRQPIRFKIVSDAALCAEVFQHTYWAAYLKDYTIRPEDQPGAYILIAADKSVNASPMFDVGAAATSLMLLAKEQGLDTCCIGNFDRKDVMQLLNLDQEAYAPCLLLALGYSDQKNRTEPLSDTVVYKYEDGSFIVPKYDLKDILL